MIIIEAGATQTKVCQIQNQDVGQVSYYEGISPTYMTEKEIQQILNLVFSDTLPEQAIHYYGTGCVSAAAQDKMKTCLIATANTTQIEIASDLLGAARATAKKDKGQINILGTGSASCLYDGQSINKIYFNTGYLFGDYGSGFHIGQSILKAYFQGKLSKATEDFIQKYSKLNKQELIQKIYANKQSKSIIADFAKCAALLRSDPDISHLIKLSFLAFIDHQIGLNANYLTTPQYFAGSIAHHFNTELKESLLEAKLDIAGICASPIKELMQYHLTYRK